MDQFILPGGGINEGESREDGAARELLEETGLIAREFKFVMNHRSPVAAHHVFIPGVLEGTAVASREIEEITWWDGIRPLETTSSVVPILSDPRIEFLAAT
jgi:8-oxo-dGTP diphosphatase